MGMNYYLFTKPCSKCSHRKEKIHVGKSSWGWAFHFAGTQVDFKSWKEMINSLEYDLIDEDGDIQDKEQFFKFVESKRDGMNLVNIVNGTPSCEKERNYISESEGRYPLQENHYNESWLDNEGYNFSTGEFS